MSGNKEPKILSSAELGFDDDEDPAAESAPDGLPVVHSEEDLFPTVNTPGGFAKVADMAINNPITTPIFRALDTPAAAMRSGIQAFQTAPGGTSLSDRIGGAGSAAYEQFTGGADTPEAPRFKDIANTAMQKAGVAAPYAEASSKIVGPALDVIGDPLNLVGIGGAKAVKSLGAVGEAVDAAKGMSKLIPEGEFFQAPMVASKADMIKDKLITTVLGPTPDSLAAYRANPDIINQARGVVPIKDLIDESVNKIKNLVTTKEETKTATKAAWDQAHKEAIDVIKSQKPPQDMRGDVLGSLDALRSKISSTSSQAFDILEETGLTIPTPRLKAGLSMQIKEFKSVPKITPEGRAALARLEQIRLNMNDLPKELTGAEAKSIIQELDAARQMAMRSGEHMDKEEQIKQLFRGSIDERLKRIPAYQEIMVGLAADTRFLKDASKALGDERTLMNKLSRVHTPGAELDRKMLKELGERTGQDFSTPVDNWSKSQELLKSKDALEKIRNALPQAREYESAVIDFENANSAAKEIVGRLSQGSTENVVKSVMRSGSIENARALEALEKQTGINFTEMIKAEKVARDFKGGKTNGSRNVNLMGGFGEAVGGSGGLGKESEAEFALDLAKGRWGKAVGALGGAYIDKFGGEIAKKLLDKETALKAANISTNGRPGLIKKILKHPMKVSPGLMRELMRPEVLSGGEVMITDKEAVEDMKKAIMDDEEMSSTEKAKSISKINSDGMITIKGGAPKTAIQTSTKPKTLDDLNEVFK